MASAASDLPPNYSAAPIHVKHAELERSDESPYRSVCPACKEGVLLVGRDDEMKLMAVDNCILCGQTFVYDDIEEMRKMDWSL